MNDRIVNIPLEHSSYPVRISTIQRFILNEIKRLSDATGYPGDQLPVRFLTSKETNGGKTIAEFVSATYQLIRKFLEKKCGASLAGLRKSRTFATAFEKQRKRRTKREFIERL